VLTDNGKVFTGRFAARPMEVLFDRICRENGIRHLLTAPRSPTTTGKIERFHGTLRRELLNGATFAALAAAQQAIDGWIVEYNTDRPHQALGGCTPAERFAARSPDPGPALDLSGLRSGAAAMTGSVGGWPAPAPSRSPGSSSASASTTAARSSTCTSPTGCSRSGPATT
jgi:hypothetical protein